MSYIVEAPRPLTEWEEFVMLLCQAAWEVGKNDSERLDKIQEMLVVFGETHPLPPLADAGNDEAKGEL